MPTLSKDSLIARSGTAEVYAWHDGQVLKLFYDWCPAEWKEHEASNARAVSATNLPLPKFIDTVQIQGRQGIIYERVNGPSMLTVMSSKPWWIARLARSFAELHTQVHKQSGDGLSPVRIALRKAIASASPSAQLQAAALEGLDQLPDGTALCHFDFHPDQVLMTTRGPVIIDWMTAVQGDPVADIARTSLLLRVGQPPNVNWWQSRLIDFARDRFYQAYLRRYFELNPDVNRTRIDAWMIPVAAARLNEGVAGEREPLLELIQSLL